jgi:DNA-binding CsgD family transcriptional regulator
MQENDVQGLEDLKIRLAGETDFAASLRAICDALGVKHAVYHLAPIGSAHLEIPFVQTTYEPRWVMRYIAQNYLAMDPVLNEGLYGKNPFFWTDIARPTAALEAFFADAATHGVGNCGFTLPVLDRSGRRAMFTVNNDEDEGQFRLRLQGKVKHLADIGGILHRRALALLGEDEKAPPLSRREIECLNWTAKGKDAASIAEILKISEFTVRDYLKSARTKLGCSNIAQAVYEATRLKIIRP